MKRNRNLSVITFRHYITASLKYKKMAFLTTGVPISALLMTTASPYFASRVLANLITSQGMVWVDFGWFVLATITSFVSSKIGIMACLKIQAYVMGDLYKTVFDRLMNLSVSFFNNSIGGKLIADSQAYAGSYGLIFNAGYITILGFFLSTIIGLAIIFVTLPLLGLLIFGVLAGLMWWSINEMKLRGDIRMDRIKVKKDLISHFSDSVVNAVTIKIFGREDDEQKTNTKLANRLTEVQARDWARTVGSETNRMGVILVIQALLLLGLIILSRNDTSIVATGIFAYTYTINILNRFFAINQSARQIDDALLDAEPVTRILEESAEIQDVDGAKDLHVSDGLIELKDVTFKYSDASENDFVFENLSLSIKPGEKVGLVGHSGGGKSTLTRMILRFSDLESGSIEIDDQNIAQVKQESLRQNVSYVPQEPLLFHRTIKENIAYGKPEATQKEIISAAKSAYADEFIKSLPNGYETVVGERGVKLSGGQRQRVAIARAILKNAPILILDEATSALDSESEQAIQKAMESLMKDKTTLVVAHRLSTINRLDRILVIDEGRIVEEGSHRLLLSKKGRYAELWSHQSGGFLDD